MTGPILILELISLLCKSLQPGAVILIQGEYGSLRYQHERCSFQDCEIYRFVQNVNYRKYKLIHKITN